MLKGFENITQPISDYEKDILLPVVLRGLKNKVGKEKAVTNKEIVSGMTKAGFKISDTTVRKLVNHIRTNSLINGLIATSKGYHISTDITEVSNYIDSLDGRINEILRIRESMQDYLHKL